MTIGLFGYSKLSDLAMIALDRNQGKGNSYRTFVTMSYSQNDYDILNVKNLEGVIGFFVASIGYKARHMRETVYESLIDIEKKTGFPHIEECIDEHSITPTPKNWRRGLGNWVMEGTVIQSYTSLGNANTIWSGSVISHHSSIGNYNWISPRATLCGESSISNSNFIGAGAIISSGVSIGSGNLICAGALVSQNMTNRQVALPGLNRILTPDNIEEEWAKLR